MQYANVCVDTVTCFMQTLFGHMISCDYLCLQHQLFFLSYKSSMNIIFSTSSMMSKFFWLLSCFKFFINHETL